MQSNYRLTSPHEIDALTRRAMEMRHQDTRQALALSMEASQAALKSDYQHGYAQSQYLVSLCYFILAEDVNIREMAFQAYSMFKSLGDLNGQALALNLPGNIYERQNQYVEAIEHHHRSLQLRQATGNVAGQAGSLNNIGLAYSEMNQIPEALEYLFKSLDLAESIGDNIICAYALCNIAEIFLQIGEVTSALQYNQRGLSLCHQTRDRALESTALTTMGRIYTQLGDHKTAFDYLQKGLELSIQTGNANDKGSVLLGLGKSQQEFSDYESARQSLSQALEYMQKTGDRAAQAEILCGLAKNHILQGEHAQAIHLLTEALDTAREIDATRQVSAARRLFSEAYEAQGNHALALEHFRAYHESEQRIFNAETQRRIRALLNLSEVKKAQHEAEEQRQRNEELSQALEAAQEADKQKEAMLQQLAIQAEMLEQLAHEDGLTGIANRRWLDILFTREFQRAERFQHPLAVAMIDIDDFKKINDTLSHLVGDDVLRAIARLLRDGCRSVDIVGRYGGEEFMLVLVETSVEQARMVCEKLCREVESHPWETIHPGIKGLTVSIGLSDNKKADSPEKLVAQADKNLYQAKRRGKNQVFGGD